MEFIKFIHINLITERFLWIWSIFVVTVVILMLINSSGILDKIKSRFNNTSYHYTDSLLFSSVFFGGLSILFMMLYEWFLERRVTILIILVNAIMLIPMILYWVGIIESLPEPFIALFFVYCFFMLTVFVSQVGHRHDKSYYSNDYINDYTEYNNSNNFYVKPKPKPRGLTKSQVSKKKRQIRIKLIENKELQEKYNL